MAPNSRVYIYSVFKLFWGIYAKNNRPSSRRTSKTCSE